MKQKLLNKLWLRVWMIVAIMTTAFSETWAERVTDYTNIVSGKKYYIGATVSGTDYYFYANGTSLGTGIQGTSKTDKAEASVLVFEGSGDSWTIKFVESGYYLSLASSKANGKVNVVENAAYWTASNASGLIQLKINNYVLQKNSSTSLNFGSYASGQKNVWLEEVADASPLVSISLSGTYPTTFHQGDAFSYEGMTVTATYEDETTADVTANAEFTGYNMSETGEQTVTVSYTEGDVTETAEYVITVNAPATLTSISLSGDYQTNFNEGEEFNHEGLVVTANYSDDTAVDVTSEAEFSTPNMDEVGTQTITVTYNEVSTTYDITINAIPTHNVTWSVNGETSSESYKEGAAITFPSDPEDVSGKTFVGWVTEAIDGTTDEAPEFVTSANMGNSIITYYAVFAEVSGAASWVEATLASMTSTDVFVFASGTYAMKNDGGTSGSPKPANITVADGKITSTVTDAMKWKVTGNGTDGYTFLKADETTKWLYCNTTTPSSSNDNLRVGTGDRKLWVYQGSYLKTNDSNTTRYLSMNGTTDFRSYVNTSNNPITPTFYKYQGPTYSNFTTDARAEAGISFANASVDAQLTSGYTGQALTNPNSLTVAYSSSDETVATVNSSKGAITELLKAGTTTITATFAGNETYKPAVTSYTLNVTEKTPAGLTYAVTEVAKSYGDENFTNTLSNPNNLAGISYGSSDTDVATIDEDGEVKIKTVGSTTITASFAGDATHAAGEASYTLTVSKATPTLNFAATNITGHIGETVSANALTNPANLTISYSSSDGTVATVNSTSGVVANPLKAGTTTITASFAGNDNYVAGNASYTLKVLANPTISVSDDDVDYGKTYTFDASGLSSYGAVTLTSGNDKIATVSGLVITPVACGTVTITVSTDENEDYRDGSATFDLTVNAPAGNTTAEQIVFNETFAESTGGPLSAWGGSEANGTLITDVSGWNNVSGSGAGSCAKYGANKAAGSGTTPSITVENGGTYQLSFKAAPWSTESSTITVTVSGGTINGNERATTSTMSTQQWNDYNYDIVATSTSMTIVFSASNNRFFLDEVKVTKLVSADPVTLNKYGFATYCSVYPLDFSDYTNQNFRAWQVTGIDGSTITFEKITTAIKGGQGVVLSGTADASITIPMKNSSTVLSSNLLHGTTAPVYFAQDEIYGLSGNAFKPNYAGVINANKAYLLITSGVKSFTFVFMDDEDGIVETKQVSREEVEQIFDLSGRRLQKMQRGINIINGRKVLK